MGRMNGNQSRPCGAKEFLTTANKQNIITTKMRYAFIKGFDNAMDRALRQWPRFAIRANLQVRRPNPTMASENTKTLTTRITWAITSGFQGVIITRGSFNHPNLPQNV